MAYLSVLRYASVVRRYEVVTPSSFKRLGLITTSRFATSITIAATEFSRRNLVAILPLRPVSAHEVARRPLRLVGFLRAAQ